MSEMGKQDIKTGICGLCGGNCLIDAYLKDGKVVKVEGNKTLPFSNGTLCCKGAALKQQLYSPDRLMYPMKRVGARGEGKFERISWEEALDTIADKMKETKEKYGAEQTMVYIGHPKWFRFHLEEFAKKYGTPNYGTESSTCAMAVMMSMRTVFGVGGFPMPDMRRCATAVIWGVNAFYSNTPRVGESLHKLKEAGKKLIVVDPRCTPTTEYADLHLRPIPGTDGTLALGLANVMISEGIFDKEYVEKYTDGFEEYKNYVAEFTPEKTEKITGVAAEDIILAARMMCEGRPTALQMSASPVVHNINGVQNVRAIIMLMALTGSFGMPGGINAPGMPPAMLGGGMFDPSRVLADVRDGISDEEFPAFSDLINQTQVTRLADYIEGKGDYPIRTLIAFGMNYRMWPRPDRLEEAFQKLDFFVNCDSFISETNMFADIILPTPLSFEREQIEMLGPNIVYYQPQVLYPESEQKNDMEILIELGKKLGFTIGTPEFHDYQDYLRFTLLPTGLTLEEVKAHPNGIESRQARRERTSEQILGKLPTKSGKIEFATEALSRRNKPNHEALPVYHEFREMLPMDEYPLILATGSRKPQLFHSRTYRLPWLANLEPVAQIDIHPDDAAKYGFANGEMAYIVTPVGRMELQINYDTSSLKGMVNVYHGAGAKDISILVDDAYYDPISGFPGFKSYCCRLEKKEGN